MRRATLIATLTAVTATGFAVGVGIAQPPGPHGDRWGERISNLDTDGDGALSKAESEAGRSEGFAKADSDGDGVLSPDELSEFRVAERQRRNAERQDRMFARLDANEDGFIDAEEFSAPGEKRFERMDTDGDGIITQAESEAARGHRGKRRHRGGDRDGVDPSDAG
ncbi:MAG: EF-hand domain-containing protein [Pseudomonadota bacterium]